MKICIELDDEMIANWSAKVDLEHEFEFIHKETVCVTDALLVKSLLFYYEWGEGYPNFVDEFSKEEVESMSQQKQIS